MTSKLNQTTFFLILERERGRTSVKRIEILGDPRVDEGRGPHHPRMEVDDLHLLRRRVLGDKLDQDRPGVLAGAIGRPRACLGEVVGGLGGHVDEELQNEWLVLCFVAGGHCPSPVR